MTISTAVRAYLLIIILIIVPALKANSQITSSPYSIFGLGSIEENSIGVNTAMGGTGIGLMSGSSINFRNPASYNGFDSLVTTFQLGFFGKLTKYSTTVTSQKLFDANIIYAAMGFRLSPRMAISFGVTPYSTVGYNINVLSPIESDPLLYNKTYQGEGGVNKVYFGSSYALSRNLVIGINASYLFGSITHSESSETFGYSLKNTTYLSNLCLNYGLNYKIVHNTRSYGIGLIFNRGKTLTTSNIQTITTSNESSELKSRTSVFKIPVSYGIGLSVNEKYFKGGIDYELKRWNDIEYNNPILKTRNSHHYSAGLEFASLGTRRVTGNMIFYRLGAEFRESYLIIEGVPINYRSISFGAGIPFKGNLSVLNLAVELGQNGSMKAGLFKENFCTLHIDIALKELWFRKRQYD